MIKSNEDVGFARVHAISEGEGTTGGSTTVHLQVGIGNGVYRAYAYLYHNEQAASREGITDSLCARGDTAASAVNLILGRAADQWEPDETRGLRRAVMEVQESLDEDGETVG